MSVCSITSEDKRKYFPLLDDMGGMEDIYTLEELQTRLKESYGLSRNETSKWWWNKWMKGVKIVHNPHYSTEDLYYYDLLVARRDNLTVTILI